MLHRDKSLFVLRDVQTRKYALWAQSSVIRQVRKTAKRDY